MRRLRAPREAAIHFPESDSRLAVLAAPSALLRASLRLARVGLRLDERTDVVMTVLDHALELIEHGLAVFPCRPKTERIFGRERKAKEPLTPHGFRDATTDETTIVRWWTERPDALVGVPTGRLLVVDVDPGGLPWFDKNALRLAYGRSHRTRRGGWHLLYGNVDPPLRCSAGKVANGVDVRGEGGYVIWWPAHELDASGDLTDIGPPPDWLVTALREPTHLDEHRKPEDWLRVAQGATEGARNQTLARLTGHLLRRGVDARVVRELGLAWSQARCNPPMDPAEAFNTIRSIVAADLKRRQRGNG